MDPGELEALLADRPDLEEALREIRAVDADRETWTFDDVAVDSGAFGQLVSEGAVEKIDGEYRLADPEAVAAALDGEGHAESDPAGSGRPSVELGLGERFDGRVAAGLAGALALVFALRITSYRSVFQGDHLVSPGNDPYHYRYWMERVSADADGPTDVAALIDGARSVRPFTYVANAFFAELLGGSEWATEFVAAWLPVASSLLVGLLVFWLAMLVTDDARVAIAAVVLLAATPIHAVYSGLGFLEHRLHQYLWMSVTLVTLAWLAVDLERRRERAPIADALRAHLVTPWTWVATLALGLSLSFSAHAWGGSVLMFGPVAAYVALRVALDVRAGVSPALANLPLLSGLALGGGLSALYHLRWGWHETFMAFVPALVLAGAVGVVALGELWRRAGLPLALLVPLELALAAAGLLGFRALQPDEWARLLERADDLFFREGATETVSLFSPEHAIVFGPVFQMGLWFYLAVAVLGWAALLVAREYEPAWLLLCVYAAYWLVLATFQVRFGAQLAIPLTVLGGFGFVYLLAWIDLARLPRPLRREEGPRPELVADGGDERIVVPTDLRHVGSIVAISLLVVGLSLALVPALVSQTTHDGAQLEAALGVAEHTEEVDSGDDRVFSAWGDQRMYNYFVNGDSRSYSVYDEERYGEIRGDPDASHEWFAGRYGYVMADGFAGLVPEELGAGGNGAYDHYKLLYRSADGELGAFAVVEGATINGTAEPGEELHVSTAVDVPGDSFTYERSVTADENGTFEVTVPYAGEYDVGSERVTVTMQEVRDGETVTAARG